MSGVSVSCIYLMQMSGASARYKCLVQVQDVSKFQVQMLIECVRYKYQVEWLGIVVRCSVR